MISLIKPAAAVVVETSTYTDDFNRADADALGGTWDATYYNSSWALSPVGSISDHFRIRTNKGQGGGASIAIAAKANVVSSRKMYAKITNKEDLTAGNNRSFRVIINAGRLGNTYCSYYYGEYGRASGGYALNIGKWWNNGSVNLISTTAVAIAVDDVIRIRHDGFGGLYLDKNGVNILFVQDLCWLRALGCGIGGVTTQDTIRMEFDNFDCGTWGAIVPPSPWTFADAVDTDAIADGLWSNSGPNNQTIITSLTRGGVLVCNSGGFNGGYLSVVDASLLSANCFIEATIQPDSSVFDSHFILRSTVAASTGYYVSPWESGGTPRWVIGKWGVGELATLNAGSPSNPYRFRFECNGTTLNLYQVDLTTGARTLKVTTTDSTYSVAGTARIYQAGFGGTNQVEDVLIGNL